MRPCVGVGTDCLTFVWKEEITIHVSKLSLLVIFNVSCHCEVCLGTTKAEITFFVSSRFSSQWIEAPLT